VAVSPGEEGRGGSLTRTTGRRKIRISYIEDKGRRQITFSKRKAGLMKKAYELTTLTGTQALLLVASETGHVYTFATPKLQPFVTLPEGKNLIQSCLNATDTAALTDSTYPEARLDASSSRSSQEFPLYAQGGSHVSSGHMMNRPQMQGIHQSLVDSGPQLDDSDDLDGDGPASGDSSQGSGWSTGKESIYGYSA